jgi:site-specific DNA recombinase
MNQRNTNVILYTRVSSDEQAEGFSLNYQEESLKRFCDKMGYNVIKIYREDHSAKNFKRPEWNELKLYAKANKRFIDKVLFAKWDRFSRNIEQALTVMREFDAMGIELNASEQYLDMTNCDNKMVLSIYLTAGEVERDKISSRTKSGVYQAKREGYYANRAPFGYDSFRDGSKASRGASKGKRSILIPNENAPFVTKAFKIVAMNIESIETTRKKLKEEGMNLEKSSFNRLLKNIVYTGKIEVPEYKKEHAMLVEGLHEPLIDLETYNKVQEVYNGKRWKGSKQSSRNEEFPLRDFLICEVCGKQITGSLSSGRSKKYAYYHCREKCKTRVQSTEAHARISNLLADLQINQNVKSLFSAVLKDSEAQINGDKEIQMKAKIDRRQVLKESLDKADDLRLNNQLTPERYNSIVERYNTELMVVNMDIEVLKSNTEPIGKYIDSGLELLTNLDTLFMESDCEGKKILAGSLFTKKLVFGNEGCRTTEINEVLYVLTKESKGSRTYQNKNGDTFSSLSVKVPGVGIEPTLLRTRV